MYKQICSKKNKDQTLQLLLLCFSKSDSDGNFSVNSKYNQFLLASGNTVFHILFHNVTVCARFCWQYVLTESTSRYMFAHGNTISVKFKGALISPN